MVCIDDSTHALLTRLAAAEGLSLEEELTLAVRARSRERFFASIDAGYANLTDAERAEEEEELRLWDATLGDGLSAD